MQEATAIARAVLQAIREPSEEMERAGYGNSKGDPDNTGIIDNPDPVVAWQAMIDAAMEEGGEKPPLDDIVGRLSNKARGIVIVQGGLRAIAERNQDLRHLERLPGNGPKSTNEIAAALLDARLISLSSPHLRGWVATRLDAVNAMRRTQEP